MPRISHFAQFGLFLCTLGSLYFFVVPLYQKALLEEGIAKKQFELLATTKALDKSYYRLRNYAVREFYVAAGPPCSGLFQPPMDASAVKAHPEQRRTRAEFVFAIDVPKCLQEMLMKTAALDELRQDDRKLFDAAASRLGAELVERRRVSLAAYEAAPSRITEADIKALPQDNFRVRGLVMIEEWNGFLQKKKGPAIDMQKRKTLAQEIAQERIGLEYEVSIRDGIRALSNIRWTEALDSSR